MVYQYIASSVPVIERRGRGYYQLKMYIVMSVKDRLLWFEADIVKRLYLRQY